ncbi:polyprenyl synthetase family protein [Spiractinospora alimapuensis]|uniref:polyprenyl synthetase family protein n=1 Tax=Spiractinospora alimapuensis TaxID=2820884 RepID=UPI0022AB07D6|nr:polyprenyl synthetase family protein [Spiractinospora alimapuensis]QVQ54260.1 polyprenyl synthetase family protein [Spiractinospora alimapuensis]
MTLSDDTESTASTLIDEPLRDAVTQHLREFMARRSDEASGLDAAFTDEVLGRLTAFVLGGGKRTRPIFAWWGWRSAGGSESGVEATAALRAASALELIQAFALIQDDVMDRSALRRGRPALHREFTTDHEMGAWLGDPRRYGSNIAVLTADLHWSGRRTCSPTRSPSAPTRGSAPGFPGEGC